MKEFAKGKRSVVYLQDDVITKKESSSSKAVNRINNEANWLSILNNHGIGPKLIEAKENEIKLELIEGKRIINYLEENSKEEIILILLKILKQCRVLDKLHINKYELTNPYKHIIIRDKKPVMIDFERCRYSELPKNVTQFCQFITSKKIMILLKRKGINIKENSLRKVLEDYKKKQEDIIFNKILGFF